MESSELFDLKSPQANGAYLDFEKTNQYFFKKLNYFIGAGINDPLSVIHTQVQELQSMVHNNKLHNDQLLMGLQRITLSNNKITALTRHLRTLSDSNSSRPKEESIFLRQLVGDAFNLSQNRLLQYQFQTFQPIDPKLIVSVRPAEVIQIFLHLIENSIQANYTNRNPWLQIEASRRDNEAILNFFDSGPGIPDLLLGDLFSPVPLKDKGPLRGLPVSAFLAKQNNGSLDVERSSHYTRFVLKLPLA